MTTKGIVLAGGRGTRLYPMTNIISKQLQPVYDKPMIYYPIATLMSAGIRDILLISTPEDIGNYENLLADGSNWGLSIEYAIQERPGGIAEAFIYGENFIGDSQVCLILGDNLFYGDMSFFRNALSQNRGATIFGYQVNDPSQYGVVEFDKDMNVASIEEKPDKPKSNFAIPGLYVFDSSVTKYVKELKPSPRGELEITDLQKQYLERKALRVELMERGIAWLDTGTPESMMEAGSFIHAIEKRQGRKIACLEELAIEKGFISKERYLAVINLLPNCSYKDYCLRVADEY